MTPVGFTEYLISNDVFVFPPLHWPRAVFEVAGIFGGGTVSPGYVDGEGEFAPFRDAAGEPITATESTGWQVTLPSSERLALSVTGAVGPDIRCQVKRVSP